MKGSRELKFEAAKTLGQPVPVSILLPVYFRHPDAPPLAGDSIIKRDSAVTDSSTAKAADTVKTEPAKAAPTKAAPAKKPPAKTTTRRKSSR
jgi:hypothetical protein